MSTFGNMESHYCNSKKTITELKKQVADLIDIKKRHQIQQTEIADKLNSENKGRLSTKYAARQADAEQQNAQFCWRRFRNGKKKPIRLN